MSVGLLAAEKIEEIVWAQLESNWNILPHGRGGWGGDKDTFRADWVFKVGRQNEQLREQQNF